MLLIQCTFYTNVSCSCNYKKEIEKENYTPTRREGAILQSSCPSVHIFVTDISASTGRNDFIFDIWLWHGDLYRVSPFQVYCTSTSCLPCDLEFFMFGIMKIFVLLLEEMILYLIYGFGMVTCTMSPSFQAYRTSTSCLPHDLEFFMFAVMKTFITDISASTGRNDFIFDIWLWHGDLYHVSPFQVYCTSTSCLPCDLRIFHVFTAFSGNECWDIYKFDTNERVGVFLARRSVQHLVLSAAYRWREKGPYHFWRFSLLLYQSYWTW